MSEEATSVQLSWEYKNPRPTPTRGEKIWAGVRRPGLGSLLVPMGKIPLQDSDTTWGDITEDDLLKNNFRSFTTQAT